MGRRGDGAGKLVEWQRRLARFESWQQTVAAFCAVEQISVPTFYVWKKRLAAGSWDSNPSELLVGAMSPKVPLDATPGVASAIASPAGDVVEVATLTEAANSTTAPASNMPSLQSDTIPTRRGRRRRAVVRRKPATPTTATQSSFLPVRISGAWTIQLELPNGVRVSIPSSDAGAIHAAISAAGRLSFVTSADARS